MMLSIFVCLFSICFFFGKVSVRSLAQYFNLFNLLKSFITCDFNYFCPVCGLSFHIFNRNTVDFLYIDLPLYNLAKPNHSLVIHSFFCIFHRIFFKDIMCDLWLKTVLLKKKKKFYFFLSYLDDLLFFLLDTGFNFSVALVRSQIDILALSWSCLFFPVNFRSSFLFPKEKLVVFFL